MVTIREASPEDFPAIWPIFREVVQAGDTYPFSPHTSREEAYLLWMENKSGVYLAEKEGETVGTYYIKPNQPPLGSHVANTGYMVKKEHRGQGIGRQLCSHSLEEAQKLGFVAIQLNLVVSTNEPALHLWKQMGFSVVGTLPLAFQHQHHGLVDAYLMYLLLKP